MPSQRYHVTPNGDWSACHAKSPASCPYGGPDGANHYDSKSQAITAAEAIVKQNSEHKPLVGKNGGRKAYYQDGVLTKAPLASIDGVPIALSPTSLEYDDALSSLPYWMESKAVINQINKTMKLDPDSDIMEEGFKPEDVTRPWQDTYMGKTFDGGDPFPSDPEARKLALDHKATEYDEKLARLAAEYKGMRIAFLHADVNHEIPDYSAARTLAHWGRALADEKAYIESMGGESHFQTNKVNAYGAMKARERAEKAQWLADHPGQEWLRQPPRFNSYELKDLDKTAGVVAREICVLQGRSPDETELVKDQILNGVDDRVLDGFLDGESNEDLDDGKTPLVRAFEASVRDAYLDKPMTDEPVLLIDIETTGLEASNIRIQDVGYAYMRLDDPETKVYGESSSQFGMGASRDETGNPTVAITGITTEDLRGRVPFENDPKAQEKLLGLLTEHPFVAHNAVYEDSNFTASVRGYAEAKRDGRVRIIDTAKIARRVEDWPGKDSNSLEMYSKRWGVIADDQGERHLGLEDAVVMGLTVGRQMQSDYARAHGRKVPSFSGTYDTGRSAGAHYDSDGGEVTNG